MSLNARDLNGNDWIFHTVMEPGLDPGVAAEKALVALRDAFDHGGFTLLELEQLEHELLGPQVGHVALSNNNQVNIIGEMPQIG